MPTQATGCISLLTSDGSTVLNRITAYDGAARTAWLEPAEGDGVSAGAGTPGPGTLSSYVVLAWPARPEGVRLAVGGDLVIDAWLHFLPTVGGRAAAASKLAAGDPAELALEYRSLAGAGSAIGGGGRVALAGMEQPYCDWRSVPSSAVGLSIFRPFYPCFFLLPSIEIIDQ